MPPQHTHSMTTYLDSLNPSQRRAATAPKAPILVLAGPGTGKTRTLVGRILYLIHEAGIAAHTILAITFTNKAKDEMKHRLHDLLGDAANDVMIGTFHRFCLNALRMHPEKVGLAKQFAVADDTAQLIALSRASRMQDEKSLRTVLGAISSYRLNRENLNPTFQDAAMKWLHPYHKELQKNNLIDFDQILLLTQVLFRDYPDLVAKYQQTFEAILIDEFQDTDPIQYQIMKDLAWKHRNIFAVADDDQSIFAWRGARIENIEQYVQDFDCRDQIVVLDENYRSAQCIINVATQLINCGDRFRQKAIRAAKKVGGLLAPEQEFHNFSDDTAEIQFILEQITQLTQPDDSVPDSTPLSYADIAVLYPNHAIGERLETALLAADIPCQLVKRQGVFDHEDVKKIVLLLSLLQNPEDDVTLEQFVELELNDKLVFQQLKQLKAKSHSFKQTLHYAARFGKVAGVSRSFLWRVIQNTFGMISNLISYVDQNPHLSLSEVINSACNLTMPAHSFTIHNNVNDLRDPLTIEGIAETLPHIQHARANQGTVYVCGHHDAYLLTLCGALLQHAGLRVMSSREAVKLAERFTSTAPSDADLFLCLDSTFAVELQSACPALSPKRIIALHTPHDIDDEVNGALFSGRSIESPFSITLTIFKLLQAFRAVETPKLFREYTAFDLETTSGDTRSAGIVEIGAVKVRDGDIVGKFSTLVNPEQPITQGAYNVHGISEAEVRDQQTFAQVLPEFLDFIGDDMLVAHNGFGFDFPIIMRLYKACRKALLPNRRFDTLPLARRLFPGQPASVDALMQRFGIQDVGGRHRALDDTVYLAAIFERLQEVEQSVNRRSECEELLELVALGQHLESRGGSGDDRPTQRTDSFPNDESPGYVQPSLRDSSSGDERDVYSCHPDAAVTHEEQLLFCLGARKLLSRFSELPEALRPLAGYHQADIKRNFDMLSAQLSEQIAEPAQVFSGKEAAISRLKEVAAAFHSGYLRQDLQRFLDHATLYTTQDDLCDVNAVNLLTIHSAKGLEFPVVFVTGVEKGNLPSFYAVREEGPLGQKKIDEQRRLFYVALTRAKRKLFVTYVDKRGDYTKKRSQFLIELGIETEEVVNHDG